MDGEGSEKIGEPALELVEFVLHKDYRGQGIGTDMMKNIMATAQLEDDLSILEYKQKYQMNMISQRIGNILG